MKTLRTKLAVMVSLVVIVGVIPTMAAPTAGAADRAPSQASVFTHGYNTGRVVTLSFDADWWSPGEVDYVLQVLRDNGITAAFGLTGRYAERFPDQARAIVAAGHKLVNHSYDHPYFTTLTRAQRWAELDAAEAAYNRLGLTSAGWFRAPYRDGYLDPGVNQDLALRGYYINFDWTFDTTGYQGASLDVILDRVHRYTVPAAIVLMHIGEGSTDPQALPSIIATLRGMGYGFTTPYRAVTKGLIGAKYAALGAQHSVLGVPRTAEMVATTSGTAVQWYQYGRMYWRNDIGTFEVHGAIVGLYAQYGSVNSFLGFPLTDETTTPDGVGRFNHFQGGSIYWTPSTWAHEVHGAIRDKWSALGWERGLLGYPLTNETTTPDGVGRFNHFQGGSIYWTPSTWAAHEVHGAIRDKWSALGWERGFLGYPTTDELAIAYGRASNFQGGHVYWSPATGAHEVHGAILDRYLQLGAPNGRLGFPTTDELPNSTGRYSDFQYGRILWNATNWATTVIYW